MTREQRDDLTYARRQLTELEFALMDGEAGAIAAGIAAAAIAGAIERVISGVEGTPALERVGLGRAY